MSARCGEMGAVTVTMAQSYQSAAGYGRRCTGGCEKKPLTANIAKKCRKGREEPQQRREEPR